MDDSAAESEIITVIAQLARPHATEEEGSEGDVRVRELEWEWVRCLKIQKACILEFSPKPYKWIRFITGVILGAEGILCATDNADAIEIDYDRPLIDGNFSLYFHVTPAELSRMFPLDPYIAEPYCATGSTTEACCDGFRDEVEGRDVRCVASDALAVMCDAAHLIGQSKGDICIKVLTNARSRDEDKNDCIDDIDDIRNGLFVVSQLHRALGRRGVAFLLTPNFAMSTNDVDPTLQPDEQRWTIHSFEAVFDPDFRHDRVCNIAIPHGQALRLPVDRTSWPPGILFDAVYAAAVMKYFSHEDFSAYLSQHWQGRFYLNGDMAQIEHERERNNMKKAQQKRERAERREKGDIEGGGKMDVYDMLLLLPQIVRRPPTAEQRERHLAEQRESELAKRKELEHKVTSWLHTKR
ncbi:hypothetical protein SCP_1102780 [Sparassis crispa]|uniref:HNH nuclease domain-containing protein n=1 Tax=Sparassis crispa TaxID=139825 RepID=A0A401GZL0_9APHY|nr:hypothetical protein SCP_1102780 [Sparassis crispa]GBE87601.1 hypothetical protein SCP_1102780 [Sparassis crispa]